jgi:hypothetical protein
LDKTITRREMMMDIEEFEEIMNDEDEGGKLLSEKGCNAMKGLLMIRKYLPDAGIEGASHDVIFSVDASELVGPELQKRMPDISTIKTG